MVREHGKPGWSHLFAGLTALGLAGAALFAAKKTVIQFRQDLADAGYGNGRHAFRFATPPQLKDGHSHLIRLRVADRGIDLTRTQKAIFCQ